MKVMMSMEMKAVVVGGGIELAFFFILLLVHMLRMVRVLLHMELVKIMVVQMIFQVIKFLLSIVSVGF